MRGACSQRLHGRRRRFGTRNNPKRVGRDLTISAEVCPIVSVRGGAPLRPTSGAGAGPLETASTRVRTTDRTLVLPRARPGRGAFLRCARAERARPGLTPATQRVRGAALPGNPTWWPAPWSSGGASRERMARRRRPHGRPSPVAWPYEIGSRCSSATPSGSRSANPTSRDTVRE